MREKLEDSLLCDRKQNRRLGRKEGNFPLSALRGGKAGMWEPVYTPHRASPRKTATPESGEGRVGGRRAWSKSEVFFPQSK